MTTAATPAPARRRGRRPSPRRSCASASTSWARGCSPSSPGPCAVETPEQLAAACEAAVAAGATMLRGDLYKHRTSPYSFQGLGADGLAMVAEQRDALRAPVGGRGARRPPARASSPTSSTSCASAPATCRTSSCSRACAQTGKPVMIKRGPVGDGRGVAARGGVRRALRATSTSSCASAASGRSSRRPATRSTSRRSSSRRSGRTSR